MIGKKKTLAEAIENLDSVQKAIDNFLIQDGSDGALFNELQHIIPVAAAYMEKGGELDFEDPKIMRRYLHDMIMLEGGLSISRKLCEGLEDEEDE